MISFSMILNLTQVRRRKMDSCSNQLMHYAVYIAPLEHRRQILIQIKLQRLPLLNVMYVFSQVKYL